MALTKKKLVTIIAPESAADDLVAVLGKIARGLSVVAARGRGEHGERPNLWHSGNIQIETVVAPSDVERILAAVEACPSETPPVAWISDVEVWPEHKFG